MTRGGTGDGAALRTLYRFAVCAVSCALLFCTLSLKLSEYFAPDNLRGKFLFGIGEGNAQTPAIPESELMYKGELFIIDEEAAIDVAPDEISDAGEDGVYPIVNADLGGGSEKTLVLRNNETSYAPDTEALLEAGLPESLEASSQAAGEPIVLILHSHATESYTPEGESSYADTTAFRTTDCEHNVVAVGRVLCDELNDAGIAANHCTTLHDAQDYNASYDNSRASVLEYLEKYPSIKYIFDIHRDAIIRSDGEMLKPVTEVNGVAAAQVMFVVGTDYFGAEHPRWEENLNVALKLQDSITRELPGLMRQINLRGASFNGQYRSGSLLIEIGSCGNTLAEAKEAARLIAGPIAKLIKDG